MRKGSRLPAANDSGRAAVAPTRSGPPSSGRGTVRLLVSACLLGDRVRYDGRDKYDPFLVETLGPFVEWVRVCPEVDSGMSTPRPAMHLVGDPRSPRLVSETGADLTEQMKRFIEDKLKELDGVELCGYVCKKDSPSSGMARVKIYDASGQARPVGAGLFTAAFRARFPHVPVEEEGGLRDARLREAFLERVFCRRRWLDLLAGGRRRSRLVEFHTDHKFLLLAHGRSRYAELGRLVAACGERRAESAYAAYEKGFAEALAQPTTVKKVADVLLHMLGFLKKLLAPDEKAELLEAIHAYRRSLVPLVVPITLIKHHACKYEVAYLARQVYLSPYPAELMLRNHV